MTRLSTIQFYQQYFAATQPCCSSTFSSLTAVQKLEILKDLMQWELNAKTEDSHDLPHQV